MPKRIADDFREQLGYQLLSLSKMCEIYDNGFYQIAIPMSMPLRVMFHTPTSPLVQKDAKGRPNPSKAKKATNAKPVAASLLTHLKAEDACLVDTCSVWEGPTPPPQLFHSGVHVYDTKPMIPRLALGGRRGFIPFLKWWDQIVFVCGKIVPRRRDVVLQTANQNGGGHVDSEYSDAIAHLDRNFLFHAGVAGEMTPVRGTHLFIIRQLAYEVLSSPALLKLGKLDSGSDFYRIGVGDSARRTPSYIAHDQVPGDSSGMDFDINIPM